MTEETEVLPKVYDVEDIGTGKKSHLSISGGGLSKAGTVSCQKDRKIISGSQRVI